MPQECSDVWMAYEAAVHWDLLTTPSMASMVFPNQFFEAERDERNFRKANKVEVRINEWTEKNMEHFNKVESVTQVE